MPNSVSVLINIVWDWVSLFKLKISVPYFKLLGFFFLSHSGCLVISLSFFPSFQKCLLFSWRSWDPCCFIISEQNDFHNLQLVLTTSSDEMEYFGFSIASSIFQFLSRNKMQVCREDFSSHLSFAHCNINKLAWQKKIGLSIHSCKLSKTHSLYADSLSWQCDFYT